MMNQILKDLRQRIDQFPPDKPILIAIEGNCTAGKTTLASLIRNEYDCNIFHMDDFFLRPEQRTSQRYQQIGGNVDYERFSEEVLLPLTAGIPFSYRPFHCRDFTLGEPIRITPKRINIIEGTYSMHPYFHDPYDLHIFLSVTPELQRERILMRPKHLHDDFFQKWIPMEQAYFEGMNIRNQADLIY